MGTCYWKGPQAGTPWVTHAEAVSSTCPTQTWSHAHSHVRGVGWGADMGPPQGTNEPCVTRRGPGSSEPCTSPGSKPVQTPLGRAPGPRLSSPGQRAVQPLQRRQKPLTPTMRFSPLGASKCRFRSGGPSALSQARSSLGHSVVLSPVLLPPPQRPVHRHIPTLLPLSLGHRMPTVSPTRISPTEADVCHYLTCDTSHFRDAKRENKRRRLGGLASLKLFSVKLPSTTPTHAPSHGPHPVHTPVTPGLRS